MNEAEWLASEDPAAMLEHVRCKASGRKLRLLVEANRCGTCESAWSDTGWSWAAKAVYLAGASCSTPARKAALLREIVGNPFRPVVVLPRDLGAVLRGLKAGTPTYRQDNVVLEEVLAWQDGLVPRLAQAAYAERGRRCERCQGKGFVWDTMWHPCVPCVGKGVIDDGALDPERLLVLADALDEAGCEEEEMLRHLRGEDSHVHGCWALDLLLGLD